MKVLFVDDSATIRHLFIPVVENMLNPDVEVIEAISSEQALQHLKDDPAIDHVICDYEMPGGNGNLVFNYIREHKLECKFALHSTFVPIELEEFKNFPNKYNQEYYIEKPKGLKQFKQEMLIFLDNSGVNLTYARISRDVFLSFNKTLCDIYLCLGNAYEKVINAGDLYNRADIDKQLKPDQNFLYIKHEDLELFQGTSDGRPYLVNDTMVDVDK